MAYMNGFDYFILGFKKYTQFSGRSSRKEFWYFALFLGIFGVACEVIDLVLFKRTGTVYALFLGVMLLPTLAVTVRRLHDVNRSGWWLLLFGTIVGILPLMIFYCQKSDAGKNRFGNVPDALSVNVQ